MNNEQKICKRLLCGLFETITGCFLTGIISCCQRLCCPEGICIINKPITIHLKRDSYGNEWDEFKILYSFKRSYLRTKKCYDHTILSNILAYKQFTIRALLVFCFNGECNDQLQFFCPLIKLQVKPNIIFLLLQFLYLSVICHQRKPT